VLSGAALSWIVLAGSNLCFSSHGCRQVGTTSLQAGHDESGSRTDVCVDRNVCECVLLYAAVWRCALQGVLCPAMLCWAILCCAVLCVLCCAGIKEVGGATIVYRTRNLRDASSWRYDGLLCTGDGGTGAGLGSRVFHSRKCIRGTGTAGRTRSAGIEASAWATAS
jgi:hypothetical protein